MTRYSERDRDFAYMAWVKSQRCRVAVDLGSDLYCTVPTKTGRRGTSEADHAGYEPALSMKCDDAETIPLCPLHHRHKTDRTGYFAGWSRERLRAWLDEQIRTVREYWHRIQAAGPLPF